MPTTPLHKIVQQLDETSQISKDYLNVKLRVFCIRCVLLFLLYLALWKVFFWVKWTLLLSIPLALFALWQILATRNRLSKKVAEIRRTIDDIEEMQAS